MNRNLAVIPILLTYVSCRDFYVGMFKRNDYLVAQDRLYKERVPYRFSVAKYGRLFKCPITYFRVVDRLGIGQGPKVEITRGGLGLKYLTLRIISTYNNPVSVNIYVGCSPEVTTRRYTPPASSGEDELKDFGLSDGDSKGKADKSSTASKVASGASSIATTVQAGDSSIAKDTSPSADVATTSVDAAATSPAAPSS